MKSFIILFLFTINGFAASITLEEFDQLKLAEIVGEIPITLRERTTTPITIPKEGIVVESMFPKAAAPFKIHCKSRYFGGSNYISSAECRLTVDLDHPEVDVFYDEVKISLKDAKLVEALFKVIPYGDPQKEMYSYGRDSGTTFEGNAANVFHYRFHCLKTSCDIRLSNIKLVQD